MSTEGIRCDNAECVVYVDELTREFPDRFELIISTLPLGWPDEHATLSGDKGAGADDLENANVRGVERETADRRDAIRRAARPPTLSTPHNGSRRYVLPVLWAREVVSQIACYARWRTAALMAREGWGRAASQRLGVPAVTRADAAKTTMPAGHRSRHWPGNRL